MSDYYCKCKTCKWIDPTEKKGYKWWCTEYHSWEDPDVVHECKRYRENDSYGGSGCFLSSACCKHSGLPDDCAELTVLRCFRDNYLLGSKEGRALVDEYYRIAPALVDQIDSHAQKDTIYAQIFSFIQAIVVLLEREEHKAAVEQYTEMVHSVQAILNS